MLFDARAVETPLANLFSSYCVECHNEDDTEGDLNLLSFDSPNAEIWRLIDEQIRFEDMPPKKAKPLPKTEREQALIDISSIIQHLDHPKRYLPDFGNYVDHGTLFSDETKPVSPAPRRIWRLREASYHNKYSSVSKDQEQPFPGTQSRGFNDYAALALVDEPSTELLLKNAAAFVEKQKNEEASTAISELLGATKTPSEDKFRQALNDQFELILRRPPTSDELNRFVKFWRKNLHSSGHPIGTKSTLMAVLLLPEAMFRLELGDGDPDHLGRVRLSQFEIARAISFALCDTLNEELWKRAKSQNLSSQTEIVSAVTDLLKKEPPRIIDFFREYFGYQHALKVFKDKPLRGIHNPQLVVNDLEYLIKNILEEDRDVLRQLLTTNKVFVNWTNKGPATAETEYAMVYGLPPDWKWTPHQPISLSEDQRSGVLTHPAWLVAWSGNFENDPVRRGKWIRTHLLGGSIPDVPIGVDTSIPNDDIPLRERIHSATSKDECWRCHRKMDPLGLPFEQYDHYGHFRNFEFNQPVNRSGIINRVGDSTLDDTKVDTPVELLKTLADSERVEQVFVRHAFRFFLGRNETPGDAKTLQDAWNAYRDSNGSFNSMIISLLSSDSFLLRQAP